jgi:hypothetical protein
MRYTLLAGCLVGLTVSIVAHAADKTKPAVIQKLLDTNLNGIASYADDDKLGFTKDRVIVLRGGSELDPDMGIRTFSGLYYAGGGGKVTHKLGKATIVIDDAKGFAYFQAPFDVAIRWVDSSGGGGGQSHSTVERIGGIAIRDGQTWSLGAIMYSRELDTDAKVIESVGKRRVELPKGEPTITGDAKLGAIVQGWLSGGFAKAAAKKGKRIASGTGPKELGFDAAAVKLATAWDKLGLVPLSIHVTQLAGGSVAFAEVHCIWPVKKTKTNVPLVLGAILVPDGAEWRWVSLQFAPD